MFPLQRHGSFEESMNNSKRGLFSLDLNLKWEINDSKPTSIKWMDCKFFSAHPDDLTNQNILHFKLRAENKALFYSISFLGFALLGSKQMPYLLVCHQLHLMSLSLSTTCVWPLAQIYFFLNLWKSTAAMEHNSFKSHSIIWCLVSVGRKQFQNLSQVSHLIIECSSVLTETTQVNTERFICRIKLITQNKHVPIWLCPQADQYMWKILV